MTTILPESNAASGRVPLVAQAQRMVLFGLVANLISNILARATSGPVAALAIVAVLAASAFNMYWVYRLCAALQKTPWVWVVAMIIPLVSFLCLVLLNQQATVFPKANGVKVGFWGAKT